MHGTAHAHGQSGGALPRQTPSLKDTASDGAWHEMQSSRAQATQHHRFSLPPGHRFAPPHASHQRGSAAHERVSRQARGVGPVRAQVDGHLRPPRDSLTLPPPLPPPATLCSENLRSSADQDVDLSGGPSAPGFFMSMPIGNRPPACGRASEQHVRRCKGIEE